MNNNTIMVGDNSRPTLITPDNPHLVEYLDVIKEFYDGEPLFTVNSALARALL